MSMDVATKKNPLSINKMDLLSRCAETIRSHKIPEHRHSTSEM